MNTTFFLRIAMPIVIILMAAFCIFVALRTLILRRPIIFSARWLFAFMGLGFLPSIMSLMTLPAKSMGVIGWINPLLFIVVLVFFWIQTKGYMAFAISDAYFREALLASSAAHGFSIEETMSRLKIKETGQEMQVAIQGWIGSAQLNPVGKNSVETVGKIARGMNDYFRNTPGKVNYLLSYFYLIVGGSLIAMSVWIFTLKI